MLFANVARLGRGVSWRKSSSFYGPAQSVRSELPSVRDSESCCAKWASSLRNACNVIAAGGGRKEFAICSLGEIENAIRNALDQNCAVYFASRDHDCAIIMSFRPGVDFAFRAFDGTNRIGDAER